MAGTETQLGHLEVVSIEAARENMLALRENEYPGRFVAAGLSLDGLHLHITTARMGRRRTSQECVYDVRGDSVYSDPWGEGIDPLTKYRTMARLGDWHVASNGEQTDAIMGAMLDEITSGHRDSPVDAAKNILDSQNHEPDPSHTPRISLIAGVGPLLPRVPAGFSIIRNDPEQPNNGEASERRFYRGHLAHVLQPGTGLSVTTYEENAEPLEPFEGAPRPIVVGETADETLSIVRDTLDATGGFLVSAAVKAVSIRTGEVTEAIAFLNNFPRPLAA